MDNNELMLNLLVSKVNDNEITLECAQEIYEIYTEGTNIDIQNTFDNMLKEFKDLRKEYKKNMKSGEYSKAKENASDIKAILVKSKQTINDIPESELSVGIGLAISFVKDYAISLVSLLAINAVISGKAEADLDTTSLVSIVSQISRLWTSYSKNKGNFDIKDLNNNRTRTVSFIDDMMVYANALEKKAEKAESKKKD